MYGQGSASGIIPRSPCVGIMLPKGQKKAAVIYDEKQIKQLIDAAKGRQSAIADFMPVHGLVTAATETPLKAHIEIRRQSSAFQNRGCPPN